MRRILAFLALLSGLAAAGLPVQAVAFAGSSEQVSTSGSSQVEKRQKRACRADKRSVPKKVDAPKSCKARKSVIIYIPTVQFGPDRAFE